MAEHESEAVEDNFDNDEDNEWDDNDSQTSASTKTTTMTTAAKLYGKDLSEYDDVDVDELLSQLTPEEINILAKEVDPDVSLFYF